MNWISSRVRSLRCNLAAREGSKPLPSWRRSYVTTNSGHRRWPMRSRTLGTHSISRIRRLENYHLTSRSCPGRTSNWTTNYRNLAKIKTHTNNSRVTHSSKRLKFGSNWDSLKWRWGICRLIMLKCVLTTRDYKCPCSNSPTNTKRCMVGYKSLRRRITS